MAGATDPVEISTAGSDFTVPDDLTVVDDATVGELLTTNATSTRHVAFVGTAATDMAIYPTSGAVPSVRLKGATATTPTSNVADGELVPVSVRICSANTTDNTQLTMHRTAGFQYGASSAGTFTPTAGTMSLSSTGHLRRAWIAASWTNAMVVALGAATTGNIVICTLTAKTMIHRVFVVITGAAAGPATVTVSVGRVGAGYIDYIVASDAKAAANTVYGDADAEIGTGLYSVAGDDHRIDDLPSWTSTTVVNAQFVSTGANLDTVTGSTGTVYLEYSILP